MSDPEYLEYQLENLDAGSPIVVQYGSNWAIWLLGVAKQLTNPDIWSPDSQRDVAVQYANELVVRLMGGSMLSSQVVSHLPMLIEPIHMEAASAEDVIWGWADANIYFRRYIKTGTANVERDWVYFDVFLSVGTYQLCFFIGRGTNKGIIEITCPDDVGLEGTLVDLYHVYNVPEYDFSLGIEVAVAKSYRFTLRKRFKNPNATANVLRLGAVIVREGV